MRNEGRGGGRGAKEDGGTEGETGRIAVRRLLWISMRGTWTTDAKLTQAVAHLRSCTGVCPAAAAATASCPMVAEMITQRVDP